MRLDRFIPIRPMLDPASHAMRTEFISGDVVKSVEDYDIYLVSGVVYVCRSECVLVCHTAGAAYMKGEKAADMCADYLKRWPRRAA